MRRAAWGLLLCLLSARPAWADDARERARQLFDESAAAYRAGQFDRAIELLEEAHRLTGESVLLFNLAKAHEGKGEIDKAIGYYERYLKEALDVADRGAIERRLETLRAQLASRSALERDVEAERRRADAERRRAADAREQRGPSPVPWVLAGVGAAGVAVGGVLGLLAKGKEDDVETEPVQLDAAELLDDAETLALGSNIALAVGGALVLGGVTWGIVDVVSNGSDRVPRGAALRAAATATVRLRLGVAGATLIVPLPR